jgi:hypothetical protein
MTRRNIEPVFKDFYADKYDKEEFLLDVDMEFYKVKKLLERQPKMLRDDPVLTVDYMKIIKLIQSKKLIEDTNEAFDAQAAYDRDWIDASLIDKEKDERERLMYARVQRDLLLEGTGSGGGDGEDYGQAMDINGGGQQVEESIKNTKKKEAKDHQKVMMQFDKLATAFQRQQGSNSTVKVAGKQGAPMVAETAGMLKKKNKVKREKSLSAKLRLKDRKGK